MFTKRFLSRVLVIYILSLCFFQSNVYSELRYNISSIDYSVIVSKINNNGVYGGLYNNMNNFSMSPFYHDGSFHDLGILDGYFSGMVLGINENGYLCGEYNGISKTAFVYDGTNFQFIERSGFATSAFGINDSGDVCGYSSSSGGSPQAFLYDGMTIHDLGTLGGINSIATGINNNDYVCGNSTLLNGDQHAFLYNGTTMLDIGTLGGATSNGAAINNSGYVCGYSELSNGDQHAFLYDGTTMRDLGTLGSSYSAANGMNNSGYVCGTSQKELNTSLDAFLYDGSTMHDLNDLIDDSSFTDHLDNAVDINDAGQIIATSGGNQYLLTPVAVPEPSAVALFFLGLAWLIRKKARF